MRVAMLALFLVACQTGSPGVFTYQTIELPRAETVAMWEQIRPDADALIDTAQKLCAPVRAVPVCRDVKALALDVQDVYVQVERKILESPPGPVIVFPRDPFLHRYLVLRDRIRRVIRQARPECAAGRIPATTCAAMEAWIVDADMADKDVRAALATPGKAVDMEKVRTAVGMAATVGKALAGVAL